MVKCVILLLIISVFSASVVNALTQKVCTELTCVKRGEECGSVNTRQDIYQHKCRSYDDTCYYTVGDGRSDQVYSSGICIQKPTLNQSCADVGSCADGYVCRNDFLTGSSKCTPSTPTTYSAGQPCTANNQCVFSNGDGTVTNQCSGGFCKYIPDGQACTTFSSQCNSRTSECYSATISTTGTCRVVPYLALGAPCDASGNTPNQVRCRDPLECIPGRNSSAGTCNYLFSQGENDGCEEDSHCSKGYCVGYSDFPYYTVGKCVEFKKTPTLHKDCVDDTYCSSGNREQCECLGDKVQCRVSEVDIDYSKKYEKAINCLNQDSVATRCGPYVSANDECYINACKKDFCAYYKESKKDLQGAQRELVGNFDDCLVRQVCDASAIFASLSFSLLAVVFVLFF